MKARILLAATLVALTALGFAISSTAQVPRLINFQGRLAEPDTGKPYADGQYNITFRIYDQPEGGDLLWEEVQEVQLAGGMFNVILGNIEPFGGKLFLTDHWLSSQVTGDAEMSPRARLCSAPYSVNADLLDGLDSSQFMRTDPPVEIVGPVGDPHAVLRADNTGTGSGVKGVSQQQYGVWGESALGTGVYGQASTGGTGVFGEGPGASGKGVEGWTDSGIGVLGAADDVGTGVKGGSAEGIGVHGISDTSYGVKGESALSYGVYGYSESNTGIAGWTDTGIAVDGATIEGTGVRAASSYGTALDVDGTADVSAGLTVGGQITGYGGLWLSGASDFVGDTDMWGELYVDNGVVAQTAYVDTLTVNSNALVGDTVTTQSLSVADPFCGKPAYDSGWVAIEQAEEIWLTHSVGGAGIDNYVVVMDQKDDAGQPNNRYAGGERFHLPPYHVKFEHGAWWSELTTSSIRIDRAPDDIYAAWVRIRIWVYED